MIEALLPEGQQCEERVEYLANERLTKEMEAQAARRDAERRQMERQRQQRAKERRAQSMRKHNRDEGDSMTTDNDALADLIVEVEANAAAVCATLAMLEQPQSVDNSVVLSPQCPVSFVPSTSGRADADGKYSESVEGRGGFADEAGQWIVSESVALAEIVDEDEDDTDGAGIVSDRENHVGDGDGDADSNINNNVEEDDDGGGAGDDDDDDQMVRLPTELFIKAEMERIRQAARMAMQATRDAHNGASVSDVTPHLDAHSSPSSVALTGDPAAGGEDGSDAKHIDAVHKQAVPESEA